MVSGNPAIYMSENAVSGEWTKRLTRNHRIEARLFPALVTTKNPCTKIRKT